MALSNSPDPSSPSFWLEAFLAHRPGGSLEEFDSWAASQAGLQGVPELAAATRGALENYIGAEQLFEVEGTEEVSRGRGSADPPGTATISVFGTRVPSPVGSWESMPALESLRPGKQIGKFTLKRFIARGGMGQVWEAEDANLRRRVALKLVLPERVDERSLALFAREARAGGRLSHPNLVTTLGHGTDGGLSWIAQELIDGSWTIKNSLDALRAEDSVPRDYHRRVAELVALIADGMQAVHDAGVIHRDLKPQNILVTGDDQPKVTDFGLARVSDDSFLSKTGDFGGTWAYMSPEQVTAKRMGLDHRTDIFSLGVVMYELLTLRRPFEGDAAHQIATRIITEEPPLASEVRSQCPIELAVICAKAMEKAPERRYGTMAELAADLRRHLAGETVLARPTGPVMRGLKWARRHPAISSTGAMAALALLVVSLLSVDLARKTVLARDSQLLAEAHALNSEALAADILSLSASKDLDDLVLEAGSLWPARPELLPRLENWMERARVLVDGQLADGSTGLQARPSLAEHEAKLAELVARSLPGQDAAMLEAARQHELYPELLRAREWLTWQRRMLQLEEWPGPTAPEQEDLELEPDELLERTNELVGTMATWPGRFGLGHALAARALELDSGEPGHFPRALVNMAWAEARRGRLEEARAALEEAREELEAAAEVAAEVAAEPAPESGSGMQRSTSDELLLVEGFLTRWEGAGLDERRRELESMATLVSSLEIEVGERYLEDPEDAWWHRQLGELVRGIRRLHDPDRGLAGSALAVPFGWGVERRAEFAREIAARSVSGLESSRLWREATGAIKTSELYDGLVLTPQLGLLPLGQDPASGLFEFAHLATGEPPVRGEDGQLATNERTGLVLVLLPGGSFWMGAQSADPEGHNYDPAAEDDEQPVHEVSLSPFFISKYEMTQGQWLRATANNPSSYSQVPISPTLDHPVEHITWGRGVEVLSQLGLVLPTEAQWEYACRAGTSSSWWPGASREEIEGKVNIADRAAARAGASWAAIDDWPELDDGSPVHARVGTYPPNPFGLHEVHGNLWEWCQDSFRSRAYELHTGTDPQVSGPASDAHISRGGGYNDPLHYVRSADRSADPAGYSSANLGLRPAMGLGR